jgi:UDP-GlcNAc:undecaprenyl-phosphate GlcNAc-1-phosphate transferase
VGFHLPNVFWAAAVPSLIAFTTTMALVPQVRRLAIECRVADKPNNRKVHLHAIPHLGGVAIFAGFFLGLLVSLGSPGGAALADRTLALLPAFLIVFGLGLVDDLRGLRAGVKLLYQILAAVCVVAMGAGFETEAGAGLLVFTAIAVLGGLWYVGVCNSVNLIDGLDGLAAGTAALAAGGFLFVALRVGEPAVIVIALCLIGSLLAFLRFNFHPARIFMGDTGSMFLGFALASLACILERRLDFWPALLGSAAVLGLPILDTVSAVCRRIVGRRHIFQADGEHTHHRLMRAGLSHRGAVLGLYGLQAVFTVLGCAVLLGHLVWFAVAVALAAATAFGVAAAARRAGASAAVEPDAVPALRAVPSLGGLTAERKPLRAARAVDPAIASEPIAPLPPAAASRPT